jgi:hypothetical protein
MVMPLERPNRSVVITNLVASTKEQERTRLHTSAGEDDRTSPMVKASQAPDSTVAQPGPSGIQGGAEVTGRDTPLIQDAGSSIYELEDGPPADLPPLEFDNGMASGSKTEVPAREAPQIPLTLKDIPESVPEDDAGQYKRGKKGSGSKLSLLLILPVILLIAVAVWKFTGGSKPGDLLKKAVSPILKAQITVVADPVGRVFMDGELMGNAKPSLAFEVKPGLHRLDIRHPKFGSRKFIVELNAGEKKEIEVKFGDQ